MQTQMSALILLAALSGGTREATTYDNYKEAYRAGRSLQLPVLVILNPGADSDTSAVDVQMLRRTNHRRGLLANYAVAVIDTSTPEGQAAHKLFKSPQLPRVSVLDKQQKWQVYRSSLALAAEDWNLVLDKFQKGEPPVLRPAPAQCLT